MARSGTDVGVRYMNLYDTLRDRLDRDDAVSPVIAVILMVAITVVLAATVYVWVSGFSDQGSGPEQASATAEGAAVGTDDVNWIRVTLTRGENAPYAESQVNYTVLAPDGSSYNTNPNADGDDHLCTDASGSGTCTNDFHDGTVNDGSTDDDNSWDVGEVLYVPCQDDGSGGSGDHSVTISVRGTTVLDTTINCDTPA